MAPGRGGGRVLLVLGLLLLIVFVAFDLTREDSFVRGVIDWFMAPRSRNERMLRRLPRTN